MSALVLRGAQTAPASLAQLEGRRKRVSPEARAAAADFDRMCAGRPLKPPPVAIVGAPRTAGQIALASEQRRERRRNGYA